MCQGRAALARSAQAHEFAFPLGQCAHQFFRTVRKFAFHRRFCIRHVAALDLGKHAACGLVEFGMKTLDDLVGNACPHLRVKRRAIDPRSECSFVVTARMRRRDFALPRHNRRAQPHFPHSVRADRAVDFINDRLGVHSGFQLWHDAVRNRRRIRMQPQ